VVLWVLAYKRAAETAPRHWTKDLWTDWRQQSEADLYPI
jgi:hypothetical protein